MSDSVPQAAKVVRLSPTCGVGMLESAFIHSFAPKLRRAESARRAGIVCALSDASALKKAAAGAAAVAIALASLDPALAISGGGKDFASKDWRGTDFSQGDFSEKDFSGGLFRGCSFSGSNLRGARMFKSELREADLSGADLTGVSIEGAILRDAKLKDAILVNAYISESIVEVGDITGADFTDALISPESAVRRLCARPDATGTNPVTNVETRESLMCPP